MADLEMRAARFYEKDGDISQDEHRRFQAEVQTLTDDFIRKIDDAMAQKDKEILQV